MAENEKIEEHETTAEPPDRAEDAALVERARAGDADAFGLLYDRWFDRTHTLVRRILRDPDTAEEVCQEAFLSAWRGLGGLEDPGAFGGWLLRIARNGAYNRSGREGRSSPVDDQALAMIEQTGADAGAGAPDGFDMASRLGRAADPAAAVADREVVALVHEAVAALGERDAEVLDLQLRYDLGPAEIGEVIGLNRNAANQLCHRVRGRFATAFRARMLWKGGRPSCDVLAAELTAAGVTRFGAEAVAVTDRHLRTCAACDERSRTLVQPAAFLGAIPLLPAPFALKARVADALATDGVPMGGSTTASAALVTRADVDPRPPTAPPSTGGSPSGPPAAVAAARPPASVARVAGRSRRRLLIAAVVGAVVLVGAGLLLQQALADDDPTAAVEQTATTVAPDVATTPAPTGDDPAAPPPSVSPTTAPATTTTVAPLAIELLDLTPDTPQASPYQLASGPVLRWRVTGATQVDVWLLTYDDTGVPVRTRVISTAASGEQPVCPGNLDGGTCGATLNTYAFEIEASDASGATVRTPPGDRPVLRIVAS